MIRIPTQLVSCCHRHQTPYLLCLAPALTWSPSICNRKRSLFSRRFSTGIECKQPEDVAKYLKQGYFKKIVVMAGAGISTPSGIPDFRTAGTGLYDNLQKYNLPYPEAIFDITYFAINPEPFFLLANELYPSGKYRPSIAHHFVKLLHDKNVLHRMYTQNIDGLERMVGVPDEKLVEAHGTFSSAACRVCLKPYKGSDIEESIFQGEVPRCSQTWCDGVIKPNIVFFGEELPKRFWYYITDMPQADLLIVMGTSLEVHPFAGIADATFPGTPRIQFNMEAAGPFRDSPRRNDVVMEGDLVKTVRRFCELLGWEADLDRDMETLAKRMASNK